MSVAPDWLTQKILDFMAVIYHCYAHTNFANDRPVYARDIAMAMSWIVDLRDGMGIDDVAKNILSPQTDKFFGDYWRQGCNAGGDDPARDPAPTAMQRRHARAVTVAKQYR